MKPFGILAALGVLWLAVPGKGTPQGEAGAEPRSEPRKQELEEKVRRYLGALERMEQGGPEDRESVRRRILERVERRIAEAMERLRAEIREIVEAEIRSAFPEGGRRDELGRPRPPVERLAPARPWLGVVLGDSEGEESVAIERVLPGSPAEKAGLCAGDRILSVLGVPVGDPEELGGVLWTRAPGDSIEVVVRRDGKEVPVSVVLGERPEDEEMGEGERGEDDEAMEDDEMARAAARRRTEAGGAVARELAFPQESRPTRIGFDDMAVGQPPQGWSFGRTGEGPEGKWTVEKDGENPVLKQSSADDTSNRFPVAVVDGKEFEDFVVTVRFKPLSGEVDQVGGLVFRYRDANNYVICRANALEGNFRLYTVIEGKRKQLRSQKARVTANEWHRLRVECKGKEVRCSFNGGDPLVAEVEGFGPGQVGVWTKADSVTLFDDLVVEPAAK